MFGPPVRVGRHDGRAERDLARRVDGPRRDSWVHRHRVIGRRHQERGQDPALFELLGNRMKADPPPLRCSRFCETSSCNILSNPATLFRHGSDKGMKRKRAVSVRPEPIPRPAHGASVRSSILVPASAAHPGRTRPWGTHVRPGGSAASNRGWRHPVGCRWRRTTVGGRLLLWRVTCVVSRPGGRSAGQVFKAGFLRSRTLC